MRIACLQFAPQVGDVSNNLNRADSVLAKADPHDLEDLDLLVLPELAFTGYNFKSLNHISPFLEPQGSGISALWARTTALKYDTNVFVGYPERIDVSPKWPTGPEYYNSALVVNGDGETIANYRKSFLYTIDETWALEGDHGFFNADIPGLGNTAMGICMDLNPYRFEAPWSAFEFAFHVQETASNLVIVTMAWLTRENGRHFSRMPEEPDMETLTYWVQRLEPLIRNEGKEEVIVVFCNRTGMEDDLVYAGTSSVVGIKDGEVNVYGILGRGAKDLLVVDTSNGPFAKLVQQREGERDTASQVSGMSRRPRKPSAEVPTIARRSKLEQMIPAYNGPRRPTPEPSTSSKPERAKPESPRVQIPTNTGSGQCAERGTPIDESPVVATPTCPSPTPLDKRPSVTLSGETLPETCLDTPCHPAESIEEEPHIYGGHVLIDASTSSTASPTSGRISEKYFWLEAQPSLKSPMMSRFPDVYQQTSSSLATPVPTSLVRIPSEHHLPKPKPEPGSKECLMTDSKYVSERGSLQRPDQPDVAEVEMGSKEDHGDAFAPPRPSSPKSRNASRTGRRMSRQFSEVEQPDLTDTIERLESLARRPGSAMDTNRQDLESSRQGWLRPRQSRHSVHMDRQVEMASLVSSLAGDNVYSADTPFLASPGIFSEMAMRPQSDVSKVSERSISRGATATGVFRPCPRAGVTTRSRSMSGQGSVHPQSRSDSSSRSSMDHQPHIEPDETRTLVWSELSKFVGEVLDQSQQRDVSRRRHREAIHHTPENFPAPNRKSRSESHGPRLVPRENQRFASRDRRGPAYQSPMKSVPASNGVNGMSSPHNPDDEIVAEIIFHAQGCPTHTQINSPGQCNGAIPNLAGDPTRPPSEQPGASLPLKGRNPSRVSQRSTPQMGRQSFSRTKAIHDKYPSYHEDSEAIGTYNPPTPPKNATQTRTVLEPCANWDCNPTLSLNTSRKSSPATSSLNIFEPTTPKAMKFDHESGTIVSSSSDPLLTGEHSTMAYLKRELIGLGTYRPKSAVW